MSDVLGPCPVCGGKEDGQGWCIGRRLFIQCASCDFSCAESHWSLLRRKMTREEASALLAPFHGSPDMGAADEQPTTAQWAALKSALTGEKT